MLNTHMKLFELLSPYHNQLLNPEQNKDDQDQQQQPKPGEDQQGKFDAGQVDQNLQDIASDAKNKDAQPEPQGAQTEPPELDDQNVKPVDDALLQQTKNQPYNTKWQHNQRGQIAPMKILGMQIDELSRLQNMVRLAMQSETMQDQVGMSDNDDMEWYSDLLKFVNTVMAFKKSNTKAQLAKINPTPAYQTQR